MLWRGFEPPTFKAPSAKNLLNTTEDFSTGRFHQDDVHIASMLRNNHFKLNPVCVHLWLLHEFLISEWFLGQQGVNRKPQCTAGAHALLEMSV